MDLGWNLLQQMGQNRLPSLRTTLHLHQEDATRREEICCSEMHLYYTFQCIILHSLSLVGPSVKHLMHCSAIHPLNVNEFITARGLIALQCTYSTSVISLPAAHGTPIGILLFL